MKHLLVITIAATALGLTGLANAARSIDRAAAAPRLAAGQGSIVFTRGGNVWRAAPDGSQLRRLTKNGTGRNPYTSPTQADSGVVVALRDTSLYRLNRNGRLLGKAHRVAAGLRNPGPLHELAFHPAVSPDGKKVALDKALLQGTYDPPPAWAG